MVWSGGSSLLQDERICYYQQEMNNFIFLLLTEQLAAIKRAVDDLRGEFNK